MASSSTIRLDGRVAVITGAASGIGAATAALFQAQGAKVVAVDRPGTWGADNHIGGGAIELEHDLAADGAPEAVIQTAADTFGAIDVLVNNAGVGGRHYLADITDEFWGQVFAVNTTAPFRLVRAALPHLRKSGRGRVVNVTSIMTADVDFGLGAYCASKAGLGGLTRMIALEEGRYGITANSVEPGATRTGITERYYSQPGVEEEWGRRTPLGRIAVATEMAKAILFFASDLSSYITGQSIRVDGGLGLHPECSATPDDR